MLDNTGYQLDSGSGSVSNRLRHLRVVVRPRAKRACDVTMSLVMLIVTVPVTSLITMALLLTGQNPVYAHVRVGRDGREFGCLKFTSMRRGADEALKQLLLNDPVAKLEWETNRKLRNDPRITRIGRILRATSLDELPQLLNILIGQMSMVGPRPVTQDEFDQHYGPIGGAAYRSVRPGLTGLWQVKGRSETGFARRVALDTYYAQRQSLRTDAVIMLQTVQVVISRKGAW